MASNNIIQSNRKWVDKNWAKMRRRRKKRKQLGENSRSRLRASKFCRNFYISTIKYSSGYDSMRVRLGSTSRLSVGNYCVISRIFEAKRIIIVLLMLKAIYSVSNEFGDRAMSNFHSVASEKLTGKLTNECVQGYKTNWLAILARTLNHWKWNFQERWWH